MVALVTLCFQLVALSPLALSLPILSCSECQACVAKDPAAYTTLRRSFAPATTFSSYFRVRTLVEVLHLPLVLTSSPDHIRLDLAY